MRYPNLRTWLHSVNNGTMYKLKFVKYFTLKQKKNKKN